VSVPDRLAGARVIGVEDLTRPWSTAVRTSLVTLDDGRRVVHQAGASTRSGRAGIGRRIRFGRAVRGAAPGLPLPEVLGGDPEADPPIVVMAYVEGTTGDRLLSSREGAALLGRLAGNVAAAIAAVPAAAIGIRRPATWGDAGRLGSAARRWLRDAGPQLAPGRGESTLAVLEGIPALFDGPPVVAHGDLAPVNLVIDGGRLAGLLDLERLRLAPAGFDAAWFRLLVRHHHPSAWPSAGPALLAATGLPDDRATASRLDDLAILACLEVLAGLPRQDPQRTTWATRLDEVLAGAS
jgi:aminoglycoside phosphotransferase (APT) family kinase protein